MREAAIIIAAFVASCGNSSAEQAAEDAAAAERQYEMVKLSEGTTTQDLCEAAERAADAYLKSENHEKYRSWRLLSMAHCSLADSERRLG